MGKIINKTMKSILIAALLGLTTARHQHTHIGRVYRDNLIAVHSTAFALDDSTADAKDEGDAAAKKADGEKKEVAAADAKVAEAAKEGAAQKSAEDVKTPKEKRAEAVAKKDKDDKTQDAEAGKQQSKEDAAAAAEEKAEDAAHEKLLNSWHEHAEKTHVHVDLETYAAGLPGKWLNTQTGSSMDESDSDSDSDDEDE